MLGAVASGAVLGAIWGAAFPIVASESRPSLAIVGHRDAQLVLVDSGEARALVFLGQPDGELIERISAMMTLFRQRIDIVIGSEPVLEERAHSLRARWNVRHAVLISGKAGNAALAMPTTVVAEPVSIGLGADMVLECSVAHRGQWIAGQDTASVHWTIKLAHPAGNVVLAPDQTSLDAFRPSGATLLVVPEVAAATLRAKAPAEALALNFDSDAAEADIADPAIPLTRIYPRDIARFTFGDGGIGMPAWTDPIP